MRVSVIGTMLAAPVVVLCIFFPNIDSQLYSSPTMRPLEAHTTLEGFNFAVQAFSNS